MDISSCSVLVKKSNKERFSEGRVSSWIFSLKAVAYHECYYKKNIVLTCVS